MIVEYFFPTPIYIFDIPNAIELNASLEKNIVEWQQKDKGVNYTNINGWHSTTDMAGKQEYQPLVNILYEAQKEVFKKESLDGDPVLGNMWANINPKGGANASHTHPNCLFSGVYYVKTPENCGLLKFEDPRPGTTLYRPMKKNTQEEKEYWREIFYKPVAGRLIMFPAWLLHSVLPNESDDIRISISWNFLQDKLHNIIKP
jgi:uncharacterized protein (TIGR02466 family)